MIERSKAPQPHRIACIGGVNIDRKLQTVGPLQYTTSNPATTTQTYGGVARNIAENLARLGAAVSLIAVIGDDQEGDAIMRHCDACNVDISHLLRLEGHTTGTYTAILEHTGQMIMALADMRIYDQLTVDALQGRWTAIASAAMIVADTNLAVEALTYLLEKARQGRVSLCLVSVSRPKLMHLPQCLDGTFLFVMNRDEAESIADAAMNGQEDLLAACEVMSRRGVQNIIITLGAEGAFWWAEGGRYGRVTTEPVVIVDDTGAGDAFTAGVISALQSDAADFERACWLGIKLARLTLQTRKSVSDQIVPQRVQQWLTEWEQRREKEIKK